MNNKNTYSALDSPESMKSTNSSINMSEYENQQQNIKNAQFSLYNHFDISSTPTSSAYDTLVQETQDLQTKRKKILDQLTNKLSNEKENKEVLQKLKKIESLLKQQEMKTKNNSNSNNIQDESRSIENQPPQYYIPKQTIPSIYPPISSTSPPLPIHHQQQQYHPYISHYSPDFTELLNCNTPMKVYNNSQPLHSPWTNQMIAALIEKYQQCLEKLEKITKLMNERKSNINELKNENNNKQQDIMRITQLYQQAMNENMSLQHDLSQSQEINKELSNECVSKDNEINRLKEVVETITNQYTYKMGENEKLNEKLNEIISQKNNEENIKQKEYERMKEIYEKLVNDTQIRQNQYEQLQNVNNEILNENAHLKTVISKLTNKNQKTENKVKELNNYIQQLNTKIDLKDTEIKSQSQMYSNKIENIKKDLKQSIKENNSYKELNESLKEQNNMLKKDNYIEITRYKQIIEDLKNQMKDMVNSLTAHKNQCPILSDEAKQGYDYKLKSEFQKEFDEKYLKMGNELTDLQKATSVLKARIVDLEAYIQKVKLQKRDLKEKIVVYENQIQQLLQLRSDDLNKLKEWEEKINMLNRQLNLKNNSSHPHPQSSSSFSPISQQQQQLKRQYSDGSGGIDPNNINILISDRITKSMDEKTKQMMNEFEELINSY